MKSLALPSLKIRVDLDPGGRIGPGKIRLLEAINRGGSISAAARMMNMSYRHAWALVDEINTTFKRAAVVGRVGGRKNGAELTPFGLSLVARYRSIERLVGEAVREDLFALRADIGT